MGRILIAEDETDLRELMALILEAAGHTVEAVADGIAAIGHLAEQRPDLVVLDVVMPRATGLEVLDAIRDRPGQRPRVLMLSALASPHDVEACFRAGADDHLTKPFTMSELQQRVQTLLDERTAQP